VEHLRKDVAPLADLRAREGVFFVTGNHEYYSGATEWVAECERLGVRVLRNERVSVGRGGESFDLAGVDDANSRGKAPGHDGPDLGAALRGRDKSREVVLLAHQPVASEEAAANDVGLVLAGHTHGGQIWPFSYLVRLRYPYPTGLQRVGARTQLYISQGTGYWGPPMRLGTDSEIAVIELVRG
jgi:predicted MPP superfamily phosphohydrolase